MTIEVPTSECDRIIRPPSGRNYKNAAHRRLKPPATNVRPAGEELARPTVAHDGLGTIHHGSIAIDAEQVAPTKKENIPCPI